MGLAGLLPAASPGLSCLCWPRRVVAGGDSGGVWPGLAGRHAGTQRPQARSFRVSPTRARVSCVATRKSSCAGTCPWPDPSGSSPSRGRLAPAVMHLGENGKIPESRGQACVPSCGTALRESRGSVVTPRRTCGFRAPAVAQRGGMLRRTRILTLNCCSVCHLEQTLGLSDRVLKNVRY